MGLDNYAARGPEEGLNDEDFDAFEEADIRLHEGILSGGPGCFRGKVYLELILDITGESLNQEWIPPERVKRMCQALMQCDPKEATKGPTRYKLDESAIINLRKFFKVCADRNLGLVGWS